MARNKIHAPRRVPPIPAGQAELAEQFRTSPLTIAATAVHLGMSATMLQRELLPRRPMPPDRMQALQRLLDTESPDP